MNIFKSKQKKFLHFIKQRAAEKGCLLCPNCGKEDILSLFSSEYNACKSTIPTIDEKLSLRYAIEIVKVYIDKYDERTPRQIVDSVVLSCDRILRTLANDRMPSNTETSQLQATFLNGTLGGPKFGGAIRLTDGKPKILINQDASQLDTVVECLGAVSLAIVRIHETRDLLTSDREPVHSAQDIASENAGRELVEKIKAYPEMESIVKESIKKFGDDPIPKIIQSLFSEGVSSEAMTMASIWLSYIGEPAISHLIKLLGNKDYELAVFAAKTLASIEGSLPHVIEALKSEDPKIRLHAAGSLQYFGPEAVQVIPVICEFIKSEIIESGETETGRIPEAVDVAVGALRRIGEAGLPMVGDLLKHENANIRLAAVTVMLRIGKPTLPLLIEARAKEKDQLVFVALQDTIGKLEKGG